jgi:Leucine rich repeat/Leucine Rich repeat
MKRGFRQKRAKQRPYAWFAAIALLTTVLLGGVPAALLGWTAFVAARQRAVVRAIHRAGGFAAYGWEWQRGQPVPNPRPWAPPWLLRRLGRDFFGDIVYVDLMDRGSDEIMVAVGHLRGVEELVLTGSEVTDVGLCQIRGLTRLRILELSNTRVSDVGMSYLRDLLNLERLDLRETKVTDRGLGHLQKLTRLEELNLDLDKITDTGLPHLAVLQQLRVLGLSFTDVTDEGLAPLTGLSHLEFIDLAGSKVSEFGAQYLRRAHRRAKVSFTPTPLF